MIYPYKYLQDHPIEKLHSYLDFFFSEMFKDENSRFNKSKFVHSDFVEIFDKYSKISKPLKKIFKAYNSLSINERTKLKMAFVNNNKIEEICSNTIEPIQYFELDSSVRDVIYDFYIFLWETALGYKKVKENGSSVTSHFKSFVKPSHQQVLVCPFCGLETLLSTDDAKDGKRDDYDHYLPKKLYPFNSVNFKNLVPMCHRCNSKYKGQKDTIFKVEKKVSRRKVFFPFDLNLSNNKVEIKINDTDEVTLFDNDNWEINISDTQRHGEELESWDEIFDIKSRYKNRIKQFEKAWTKIILDEYRKEKSKGTYNEIEFRQRFLNTIDVFSTPNGIIQNVYYDFFFQNLDLELMEL